MSAAGDILALFLAVLGLSEAISAQAADIRGKKERMKERTRKCTIRQQNDGRATKCFPREQS
jgi:hypothetical protein